ncbi:MAG TPA: TIGR00269 family protein [Candidatus Norongarragalinales archaeon]|jgi:uncharacterized protein (TIGR00269 family)|nr:TIGR00269 family protein [Candidatus Norongarragalinales archaeon]
MTNCTDCGKEAVARFKYTNTDWCSECFLRVFRNRVARAIKEQGGFERGQRIGVAVSGGKDSAALLHSLAQNADAKGVELVPILIDEGIAGYRNEAIPKAQAVCDSLGLPLHVVSYKQMFDTSMDEVMSNPLRVERSCSYCGVFRKSALNKAAFDLGCDKLAMGHNADDAAQTMMLNLMRGEVKRIAQWDNDLDNEKLVPRVRPLVYVPEREAALYCELNSLPYHRAECPYSNEGLRQDVKKYLNEQEEKYPGTKFRLLNSFLQLKEQLKSDEASKVLLLFCKDCGAPSSQKVCRACEMLDGLEA